MRLYLFNQITKEIKVHFWMNTTHNMHLCNRLAIIRPDNIHHLFGTQFPTIFLLFQEPGIGAEIAGIDTNISRLYMKIPIKESIVAMLRLPYVIGKSGKVSQLSFLKKKHAFFIRNAMTIINLFSNSFKLLIKAAVINY